MADKYNTLKEEYNVGQNNGYTTKTVITDDNDTIEVQVPRDIQRHLQQVYGVEVSPETISNITESVMADVREWQNRPLEKS